MNALMDANPYDLSADILTALGLLTSALESGERPSEATEAVTIMARTSTHLLVDRVQSLEADLRQADYERGQWADRYHTADSQRLQLVNALKEISDQEVVRYSNGFDLTSSEAVELACKALAKDVA